jgi:hypothetical protein
MFVTQQSLPGSFQPSITPQALVDNYLQTQAAINNPGKIICVGPQYQHKCMQSIQGNTNYPLTPLGNRRQGGYFAKAFWKTAIQNQTWRPLSPRKIVRDGVNVYVDFWVPVPPLVLDLALVTPPTTPGGLYGFEWYDNSGAPPTITTVNVLSPTTVQIVLSAVPAAGNNQLRYAYSYTQTSGGYTFCGNSGVGPKGNLRDSDSTVNYYGDKLYNWCVHFSYACN